MLHDETGYLTPPEAVPFADKIIDILHNDALRQRFAAAAVVRAEQFLSVDMATNLVSVYNQVLGRDDAASTPLDFVA